MKKYTQVYVQAPLKAGFMDTTQISRIDITKVKTKQVHISMWKEEWLQLTFKDEWTTGEGLESDDGIGPGLL